MIFFLLFSGLHYFLSITLWFAYVYLRIYIKSKIAHFTLYVTYYPHGIIRFHLQYCCFGGWTICFYLSPFCEIQVCRIPNVIVHKYDLFFQYLLTISFSNSWKKKLHIISISLCKIVIFIAFLFSRLLYLECQFVYVSYGHKQTLGLLQWNIALNIRFF